MIEPLTTTAPLIGSTVAVVVGGLALFAMLALPALRAPAMLLGLARWLSRYLTGLLHRRAILADPTRPLRVAGLSTPLARLILRLALALGGLATLAAAPAESGPVATSINTFGLELHRRLAAGACSRLSLSMTSRLTSLSVANTTPRRGRP